MLPTDEVTEVTNTLNKLIPGVHIQSLQTNFEGFPVNTLLHHCFCILVTRVSHHCHFLERLEQIVKIIKLKPIQPVFLYEVRNVLSAQQSVLLIQLSHHIFLRQRTAQQIPRVCLWLFLSSLFPFYLLHHQLDPLRHKLMAVIR